MTRARVEELYKIIADAQSELKSLREVCKHSSYHIGWYSWRIGNMQPMRICDECRDAFANPTQLETNDFMAQEKVNRAKFLKEQNYSPELIEDIEEAYKSQDCWTRKIT